MGLSSIYIYDVQFFILEHVVLRAAFSDDDDEVEKEEECLQNKDMKGVVFARSEREGQKLPKLIHAARWRTRGTESRANDETVVHVRFDSGSASALGRPRERRRCAPQVTGYDGKVQCPDYNDLRNAMEGIDLGDGDSWVREFGKVNPAVTLRILEARKAYCEEFDYEMLESFRGRRYRESEHGIDDGDYEQIVREKRKKKKKKRLDNLVLRCGVLL